MNRGSDVNTGIPGRLALFALGVMVLGIGIGEATGITGLDENWHSMRTALQSLEEDRWLVPVLDGEARIEKPPLFYWLMMLSMQTLGTTFAAARLPALGFGLILAATTAALYRHLFNKSGRVAFLVVLTMLSVAVESRRAMLDLPVAACVAVAMLAILKAVADARTLRWWALAAVALLCGFLIKGPVAAWFMLAAMIAIRLCPPVGGHAPSLRNALLFTGLTGVLLAAWPALVWLSVPDAWSRLAEDAVDRQVGMPGVKNLVALAGALVVAGLPWTAVAAASLRRRDTTTAERDALGWLALWVAISLIPFLFMRTFERYLLPLVVPLALLATHAIRCGTDGLRWKLLSACGLAALPIGAILMVYVWFAGHATTGPAFDALWPAAGGALLLVGALAGAWIRRAEAVLACLAGALALTVGAVFPALRVNEIPPDVIQTMVRHPTAHFASPYPGTASMQVGRSLPYFGTSDTKALHDWARHTGFLVMRAEDYDDLEVACRTLGVLVTPVKDFRMLYSRGSFMRITRAGVTPEEWRKAFRERSLEDLTPRFLLVQLRLQPQGSTS